MNRRPKRHVAAFLAMVVALSGACAQGSSTTATGSTGATTASSRPAATSTVSSDDQSLLDCLEDQDQDAATVLDAVEAQNLTKVSEEAARAFLEATARCYATVAALSGPEASCYVDASLAVIDERGPAQMLADLSAVSAGTADESLITDPVDAQMQQRCPTAAATIRAQVDALEGK